MCFHRLEKQRKKLHKEYLLKDMKDEKDEKLEKVPFINILIFAWPFTAELILF